MNSRAIDEILDEISSDHFCSVAADDTVPRSVVFRLISGQELSFAFNERARVLPGSLGMLDDLFGRFEGKDGCVVMSTVQGVDHVIADEAGGVERRRAGALRGARRRRGAAGEGRHGGGALMPKSIVITGTPFGGFSFHGPFASDDEAIAYAEEKQLAAEGASIEKDWWIADLISPDPNAEAFYEECNFERGHPDGEDD